MHALVGHSNDPDHQIITLTPRDLYFTGSYEDLLSEIDNRTFRTSPKKSLKKF